MLFFKECKKVLFSLTFLIYLVAVIGFYFTQFHEDCKEKLSQPVQGLADYGTVAKEVPEILMARATDELVTEYLRGYYIAYPIGFFKRVKLSEKKSIKIAEIIEEIAGVSKQELDNFSDFNEGEMTMIPDGNGGYIPVVEKPNIPEINIPDTMTYEHFRELMRKADKIIGGGSQYSDGFIVNNFSLVPKTYEDALADYNDIFEKDKITGAYARLFCDYLGIIVSILPVFAATALVNADRKSRMEQLAYSRKISSAKLVFTRYAALIFMMIIPVIITAVIAHMTVKKLYSGNSIDNLAIFKNALIWLVPNIMLSTAVGMIITELGSGIIAIFVQGALWFGSIFAGASSLTGNIQKFTLVVRHNSLYDADIFNAQYSTFIFNRIFFTVLSIAMITITAFVYGQKRRGKLNGLHIGIKNTKNKSET